MQFIANGPDIPNELLHAHEEGNVIFFCGAGISYPAGLPGFEKLVEKLYELNGTSYEHSKSEQFAFNSKQYDVALHQLEQRLPGGRDEMRKKLLEALQPQLNRPNAIETHRALLDLARNRDGKLRLVTTNFDRLFHHAVEATFYEYAAPLLPAPKKSQWDGLVYLHGLLPERPNSTDLNRLVITSGDFGLAYLTEGWAARFVTRLFRDYTVCFVGYSINDPVLRYMIDALAADRLLGEHSPKAWIFSDCEPEEEVQQTAQWQSKGVTPILYYVKENDHSLLHHTLKQWANVYLNGIKAKKDIIREYVNCDPKQNTQEDNFVGRMLWALSDRSGEPAKFFANFTPTPSLKWLAVFTETSFGHQDLPLFGITPNSSENSQLSFSLMNRPASYDCAQRMQITHNQNTSWDKVMVELADWLLDHLNDPQLLLWVTSPNHQLENRWKQRLEATLKERIEWQYQGHSAKIAQIKQRAPNAIPDEKMRKLWQLVINGQVNPKQYDYKLQFWKKRLQQEGPTNILRFELRQLLAPRVCLQKSDYGNDPVRKSVVLNCGYYQINSTLSGNNPPPLSPMLEELQQLLCDALDLLRELGDADDHLESYLPSISAHEQNGEYHDWINKQWMILIELLRDAWLALLNDDKAKAARIANTWFTLPYPTFKRLALFAASQHTGIKAKQWIDLLLTEEASCLWSQATKREVLRLFVLQGRRLTNTQQQRLESAILNGLPENMLCTGWSENQRQENSDYAIWLRLAKLISSGVTLGDSAMAKFDELTHRYPEWQLAEDERMIGSIADDNHRRNISVAPRKRKELVQWLKDTPVQNRWSAFNRNTWADVCRKHPLNSFYALQDLADSDIWPIERWRVALEKWCAKYKVKRVWRHVSLWIVSAPDEKLKDLLSELAWWLKAVAESISKCEELALLAQRIVVLLKSMEDGEQENNETNFVDSAINRPIGRITRAMINCYLKIHTPNDGDTLPTDIKVFFTLLCEPSKQQFRDARVLLGSALIAIFRVDSEWTRQHLLPLFSWENPDEAKMVWAGFLSTARLYPPVQLALKQDMLAARSKHYDALGNHGKQFATFLTYAALERLEGLSLEEFCPVFAALPPAGLEASAQALLQALEGADTQREAYWENRIQPFWQQVWPKDKHLNTPSMSYLLARLAITAREAFPAAIDAINGWLDRIEPDNYHDIISLLHETDLCSRFPDKALQLLNGVIRQSPFFPEDLSQCLDDIGNANPSLKTTPRYQQLKNFTPMA
ncbi:anti-phage defense-associated sirtuin Dsr1 [Serratia microhaemolytica]|uniref:anti-phage defense-associated sirtuin Dsr1 n=1 Tax=Serratia microhaemolytica TaxID=2675110 RepID=UPI000FDE0597|nr:anti-phage defense-associated sirtuin Dsr1 [Serratia microhaemolytica]